jgi:thiol:disulfide interchange protein
MTLALMLGAALITGATSCSLHPKGGVKSADAAIYIGINRVTPEQLVQVLPEAKDKPVLIDFSSKYCLDCQKLEPVLHTMMPQYKNIVFKGFDVMRDRQAHGDILKLFKPTAVPVLVFIAPGGKIVNVKYDYHPAEELKPLMENLNAMTAEAPKQS